MSWYCVRTERRTEFLAKAGLEALFPQVYLPVYIARISHAGRVTHEPRVLFPRYLFVVSETPGDLRQANRMRGVDYLITGADERPISVPEIQMQNLRGAVEKHNAQTQEKKSSPFRTGQELRVMVGPFTSFSGICTMAEGERVKILLTILGGHSPVEFPTRCVEACA